ncbi:MAG: Asp-tRNA(Asn)/Glu-tRNA(Gln) amidotransferase subunit GatC [Patescibacteria group bacterium]|nr:Asp-tRNA(Asn)/Glu-tRNA(Gln) amidotransferase subunit GatC [Patescibacteria group bacterium]
MLTQEEVKHIADLARLELVPEEIEKYQTQLGRILDYINKLAEAKTEGVSTADGGTTDLENVWRTDEKSEIGNQKSGTDLIKMAGEVEGGQVKVKSVF